MFQFLYLKMSIELGKNLVAGHRSVSNAAVQYLFFTYFTISGHNKLAMSKKMCEIHKTQEISAIPLPRQGQGCNGL